MQTYVNGKPVGQAYAAVRFQQYYVKKGVSDMDEIRALWEQCKVSEDARDNWLPDHIEIVA